MRIQILILGFKGLKILLQDDVPGPLAIGKVSKWALKGFLPRNTEEDFFEPYQGSHSLEKSLNFRGSPWKVLEFHFSLKSP